MAKEKHFMTMDGNTAAAHTSYAFSEVAGIYPITPSSPMADVVDQWSQKGLKNIFGETVDVIEMQSEGGAAALVHGSLNAGALTTTYTASQGLLLMIPNMYKIAGELLPGVFHVAARAVASHALSIFGDHSDVMATRQTGFALLASSNVQEAMDLAAVAHLSAIKGRVPFVHFFDGFRTSHEIQKIEVLDFDELAAITDFEAIDAFRERALNPANPELRGSAQNPDVFFQNREAANPYYEALPEIVEDYMGKISEITGRDYDFFNYHGAPDAEYVVIAMGSVCDTIMQTVDYLNAQGDGKYGCVNVHLYRPWRAEKLLEVIPETVQRIAVLDRTKEPGTQGEPLLQDVIQSYMNAENHPMIIGGRYGLGSKDTTPDDIIACFKNLRSENPKPKFTLSITDDVTHLSLPRETHVRVLPDSTVECRFWGLGSDGTVGANKNSIKIIGDHTDKYAQAYFSYDSKKSGGVTISDLRFGDEPIRAPYLINMADFISCSQQSYVGRYDMLDALKEGGSFLLNTQWKGEELERMLPASFKRKLVEKKARFFTVDAVDIAGELGLGNRTNTVLQAAFFKLSNILPVEDAVKYMKEAIVKSYGHKGDDIVNMNYGAVDAGIEQVVEIDVPESWANATDDDREDLEKNARPAFVAEVADILNKQEGDRLPVSTFVERADGTMPQGTSQYEKRGIAVQVPHWIPENCIQCNQCSFVCPHAVIRPFLVTEEQAAKAPEGTEFRDGMRPYDDMKYRIQVSTLDCTGCGSCVNTCPAKNKAIEMRPFDDEVEENAPRWDYLISLPHAKNPMGNTNVKGTQFNQPLLEFSGACGGCGETPYAKLVTQLVGDRMQISNATGCSSIWGGSYPSSPYTTNDDGRGPSWVNSLFEDNAENGMGLHIGAKQIRSRVLNKAKALQDADLGEASEALNAWIDGYDNSEETIELSEKLAQALSSYEGDAETKAKVQDLLKYQDYFSKRSTWIFGGDGWAYDIGFGGLDHVLASGENINVLVFDTEVYSNTGGQASKATPTGAIAEFAAGGKKTRKKDLGMMAMSYGYVYVAQISMGANQNQTLKAIREAEAYDGPSLIIAYSPCINHGIKGGLTLAQTVMKEAVDAGYWHLYRFDPRLADEGKNPFQIDSKEPTGDLRKFMMREVRYNSLFKKYPEEVANEIFEQAEKDAHARYMNYVRMAEEGDFSKE